jgi:AcrR family transcriptional regulator
VSASPLSRREEVLARVIDTAAADGIGARSLRDLAAAAGTSHRMLIHYFGSREGLLVAIVEEMEARQRASIPELPSDPAGALEALWSRLSEPSMRAFERLFCECYARGAQGEAPFAALLPGIVDDYLARFPPGPDRDGARLALAVIRGLLLDLVATEDRDGTDRAMAVFVDLVRTIDGGIGRRSPDAAK